MSNATSDNESSSAEGIRRWWGNALTKSFDTKAEIISSDTRPWWEDGCEPAEEQARGIKSVFLTSLAGAVFRACTHAVSNTTVSTAFSVKSPETLSVTDEIRETTLQLMRDLQAIPANELVHGVRMEVMDELFANTKTPNYQYFCDALTRAVLTDHKCVRDDAKSAAIRYFGIYESPLKTSDLANTFLAVLDAGSEEAATAAARSLADIGNLGTIPALKSVLRTKEGTDLAREIRKTVRTIEGLHGVDPHS